MTALSFLSLPRLSRFVTAPFAPSVRFSKSVRFPESDIVHDVSDSNSGYPIFPA
jgi:hypothetical protein